MTDGPLLLDSITDAKENAAGRLVVTGSHGGLYAATLASRAGARAVVFNDAGIGLEEAGVAGVRALGEVGLAAAAADCASCRIGSAEDALGRGRISFANEVARALGVAPGQAVGTAVRRLAAATRTTEALPAQAEARRQVVLAGSSLAVWLLDSASLVRPEDAGAVIVTGSHGGLVGGDPSRSLKAAARIAVFNDAGGGLDEAGIARLPVLERQGASAVTVGCMTARIGDAGSALESGVISHANGPARDLGARAGRSLKDWLCGL